MEDWLDLQPDPKQVKKEREKARALRKTDWWRAQLQKGVCHYCKQKVGAENLTMDHVIPIARGGKSVRSNCVPCCKECNNEKKAYTPVEHLLSELEEQSKRAKEKRAKKEEPNGKSPEERLLDAIFGSNEEEFLNIIPERRSSKRKRRNRKD